MTLPLSRSEATDAGPTAVLYSVDAVVRILDSSRSTIWAHVGAKNIATVRIGRAVRISSEEVSRLVREGLPDRPGGHRRRA